MSSSSSSTCILIEVRNRKKRGKWKLWGGGAKKIWGSQLIGKIEWMEGGEFVNEVLKAVIIAGKQEASFSPSSLIPRSNTKIAPLFMSSPTQHPTPSPLLISLLAASVRAVNNGFSHLGGKEDSAVGKGESKKKSS